MASIVVGDLPEHAWAASPRTRSALAALLPGMDLGAADRLSGGESRRVALASVLIGEHDLLLLDEPTNHLDVEAIDWLAQHLAARPEALVAVTHDRWFLDAVCNRTWSWPTAGCTLTRAGTPRTCWPGGTGRVAEATDRRRRTCCARNWPGGAAVAWTRKPRFRVDAANVLIEEEPPRGTGRSDPVAIDAARP